MTEKEKLVKKFLSAYGLQVVSAMRELFCDATCPHNELDAAYMQGRNSVILRLYELLETEENE
jgi:hypothetical protein